MSWFKRSVTAMGGVLFRGGMPPRVEEFAQLAGSGVTVRPEKGRRGQDIVWSVQLEHPTWGKAELFCTREPLRLPKELLALDPMLTDEDRAEIAAAGSIVHVTMNTPASNLLRGHKHFLRLLRLLMGSDGLAAVDARAQRCWSRSALDDELAHDADVDIESLFVLHAVYEEQDEQRRVFWLHSHGLGELGYVDFDILLPSEDFMSSANDPTRAIALAIVEEALGPGKSAFPLCHPGGMVEAVEAAQFDRSAPRQYASLREAEGHVERRVVMCEPRGGWLRRMLGREILPARWMMEPVEGRRVVAFSSSATRLMAERARATYQRLRELNDELAEFELPVLVKLGYPIDGGGDDEREHMWFRVHALRESSIDATLLNQPFNVSRLSEGDRGEHGVELLTDWTIMTPVGPINPRCMTAHRLIRQNRDRFRELMRQATTSGELTEE